MNILKFITFIFLLLLQIPLFAQPGYNLNVGAELRSMGNAGIALGSDYNAISNNPAWLGIENLIFKNGSLFFSRDPRYIMDSDSRNVFGAAYQFPSRYTLGIFFASNIFDSPGKLYVYDINGDLEGIYTDNYFYALKLGVGLNVIKNHNFGLNIKYFHWHWDPSSRDKVFCVDIGYILNINDKFNFGFTLLNMGNNTESRITDNCVHHYGIPFKIALGVSYNDTLKVKGKSLFNIKGEINLSREFIDEYYDDSTGQKASPFYKAIYRDIADDSFSDNLKEVQIGIGFGLTFFNTVSIRAGGWSKARPEDRAFCIGSGIHLFNHLCLDGFYNFNKMAYYQSTDTYNENYYEWTVTLTNLLKWNKTDIRWWK